MSNQNYSTQNGVSPEYNARSIIDTQYLATTNCLSQSANTFPDTTHLVHFHQIVVLPEYHTQCITATQYHTTTNCLSLSANTFQDTTQLVHFPRIVVLPEYHTQCIIATQYRTTTCLSLSANPTTDAPIQIILPQMTFHQNTIPNVSLTSITLFSPTVCHFQLTLSQMHPILIILPKMIFHLNTIPNVSLPHNTAPPPTVCHNQLTLSKIPLT
ncbi:MAG TPA: hypothetical protein VMW74_01690 [Nitrosopumilaceae archaeon]|nr:hypothetical protein [Nitrosopumilaceae archaeon]